jgi:hypothetical protein
MLPIKIKCNIREYYKKNILWSPVVKNDKKQFSQLCVAFYAYVSEYLGV